MQATPGRCGTRPRASRPHRMATSGPPRSTSASMARAVTCSQPRPRWLAGLPGATVSTRLSSSTPWSAHGVRSPLLGVGTPRSVSSSREDVDQAPRHRPHVGGDRERQPHRVPGRRVGVLADDEDAHVIHRSARMRAARAPRRAGSRAPRRPRRAGTRRAAATTGSTGARACAHDGCTSSPRGRAGVVVLIGPTVSPRPRAVSTWFSPPGDRGEPCANRTKSRGWMPSAEDRGDVVEAARAPAGTRPTCRASRVRAGRPRRAP